MAWSSRPRRYGGGVRRAPGEMNKTESAYSMFLASEMKNGSIDWFEFDAVKLRLADKTFYTPDFMVMMSDGTIEIHEVKGATKNKVTGQSKPWVEDDAAVKIKVAARLFPFRFKMVWPDKMLGWASQSY